MANETFKPLAKSAVAVLILSASAYAAPPLLPPIEPLLAQAETAAPTPIPGGSPAPPPPETVVNPDIKPGATAKAVPPIEPAPPLPEENQPADPRQLEQFKEAMANVYSRHPQIRAQREAVKVADEAVAQAISGFRPSIGAGYERGRARVNDANQQWVYGDTRDKNLNVTQDLFNGGESMASFASAKNRVKAARAELLDLEQQVFSNAVVAYTNVVATKQVVELNRSNVDVLGKQFEATSARFDVGDVTRTDVSQSEARRAQADADERQALGNYAAARATFRRIFGFDPPDDLMMPPLPPGLPATFEETAARAEAANPAIEAAQFLERAAFTDIDVQRAALLPDVRLQASMGRGDTVSVFSGGQRAVDNDAITLNVSIPLYQSGAEWSRLRQARNQAQQARFNALDTRDAVVESAARAWHDYHTARAVINSTREAVEAARVALEGVRAENQYGVRTILDVLDAEQESFFTRVNLIQAQAAERTQAYRLLATTGRLTARNLGLPVTLYNPKEHYDDVKFQLIGF
jgi:outer membrane protein